MSFINFRCVLVHNLKLVVRKYTVKRKFPQSVEEIDNLPGRKFFSIKKIRYSLHLQCLNMWGEIKIERDSTYGAE